MTDRIGLQLGNYRLTRLLGRGGFAEVYLGKHILLGTSIAIKVLRTRVVPEDMAEFQQEARILASLKHPHIVRILDFGIEEQTPYLMMDYAPNGTLRTRHPKGSVLPVAIVVEYIKQLSQALQYAHERKIVHRDIKPENMLIGEQNEILLSDFGIALIAQSSRYQKTTDMVGTVAYMSPEQITGHPRTASDQYALGIVAYEWLSGTRPFRGSFPEIAVQHNITPPASLRERQPAISPDIEHVILTALAKRPENRFASISAFANALEQASQDCIQTERARFISPLSFPPPNIPGPPMTTGRGAIENPVNFVNPPHIPGSPMTTGRPPAQPPLQPGGPSGARTTQADQSVYMAMRQTEAPSNLSGSERVIRVSRRVVLIGGGVVIVAAGTGALVIWRILTPSYQPFTYKGHSGRVWGVAWSPDGQRIVSGSWDKTVLVWNSGDGSNVVAYKGHSDQIWGVTWSPDGKYIASCARDKTVQVFNANNGSHILTYTGHSDWVRAVAWSPDGQRIASSSFDKTVQVWNAANGSHILTYGEHTDAVYAVAWSPDGTRIASGSNDKTVQIWNTHDGSRLVTCLGHASWVNTVAWSPDGKRIASGSGDETVQMWNVSDGAHIFTYRGHASWVNTVAWSPDGKRIASGSGDKTVGGGDKSVHVWSAHDGSRILAYREHTDAVYAVAWSPDGTRIASGSNDRTVRVWSIG